MQHHSASEPCSSSMRLTLVTDVAVEFLQHVPDLRQGRALLVQQRQHALADAHVADEPQVADDQGHLHALNSW